MSTTSVNPSPEGKVHEASCHDVQPALMGKRAGMVVFSSYPADPRPRRAAEALAREGMEVDLLCQSDDNLPRLEQVGCISIRRLPIQHDRGGKLSYAYQYFAFLLMSGLILSWRSLRRRYDLVYVHNMPDILVFCAILPKLLGAKVILDQHDPVPELMKTIFKLEDDSLQVRIMCWLEKISLAYADLVITVNLACKNIFAGRSCRTGKIGVVMNSPDEEIFPYHSVCSQAVSTRLRERPFVIMYHGSLVERNGLDLAVDALALVRESVSNIELRIYGRKTAFLQKVLERASKLGLERNAVYLGSKKLEELVGEIENCDVGIIPNQRNAFTEINTPTRIFEYLALGKPVIAPRTQGIQDYFDPQSLVFFESGNAKDLAESIEYVYEHPDEMCRIAERSQRIYQQHTWSQEREVLVGLVRDLVIGDEASSPLTSVSSSTVS
jgi:glycosyltransferase involved in cell wall biosynthesis